MDVRIGMQNVAREVALETEQSAEDVKTAVESAIKEGSLLSLTDVKGNQILVAGGNIAFVELGAAKARPVGFAQA